MPSCRPGTTTDFPCCTIDRFAMRAATTTPVDAAPAYHARFGAAVGLPRCYGESASTTTFRGLLSVYSRCGPHGPLASYEAFSRSASAHLLPPGPPLVLPAGARVGRVGLHRRINRALARHTQQLGREPDPADCPRPLELALRGKLARWEACGDDHESGALCPDQRARPVRLPQGRIGAVADATGIANRRVTAASLEAGLGNLTHMQRRRLILVWVKKMRAVLVG